MIKTTKDGRTIRTAKDYTAFRWTLWESQEGRCANCGRFICVLRPLEFDDSCHVHHENGRGMGGGKRDDTTEACKALCGKCHRKEHNQQ